MGNDKAANIDNAKCIACGACVYQCPFGAIMDKSYILNVIDILKKVKIMKSIKYMQLWLHPFLVSLFMPNLVKSFLVLKS